MGHSESVATTLQPSESPELGLQSPPSFPPPHLDPDPQPSDQSDLMAAKDGEKEGKLSEQLKQLDLKEEKKEEVVVKEQAAAAWDGWDEFEIGETYKEDNREENGNWNDNWNSEGDNNWNAEKYDNWNGDKNKNWNDKWNDERKVGDEDEKEEEEEMSNSGAGGYQYPVRPDAEDCAYYMKTGNCKFGSNCKFNHPLTRKNMVTKEKVKEQEESSERPGQTECKYYLRTGGCKYGKACRFNHSRAKSPIIPTKSPVFPPVLEFNFLGLPIRQGERECPYYMRNGSCKYGANCKFNHPDPTAVGGSDPSPVFGNGGSASLQVSSQSTVAPWPSPGAINETAPFMPIIFPPTQGVPSHNSDWNGYQSPVYPPERSMHPPPAYVVSNPATETNVYTQQQQLLVDEFPERPGQPECSYFLKTGDCKFKSNCKYHHPKNRLSKLPPCTLSDKGLPLRPGQNICSYYSRYGICKFGPGCRFDHSVQPASATGSGDAQTTTFSNSTTIDEGWDG